MNRSASDVLRRADDVLRGQPGSYPWSLLVCCGLFYGGVMGSFAVERFGTERLQNVTRREIDERFKLFQEISHLDYTGA
jgi:hypothetical protein